MPWKRIVPTTPIQDKNLLRFGRGSNAAENILYGVVGVFYGEQPELSIAYSGQ